MYNYKAKVLRVYDGDSITVLIQLGFNIILKQNIRILGIDTPEIRTKNKKEKAFGLKVRDFLEEWIQDKEVIIITEKPDKFGGRYLAHVETIDGTNVAWVLKSKGYAKPYDGGKKKPWTSEEMK